ncbi:MAG TPA: hypothetical protein DDZ41_12210 [Flavobacterium sp.]|nr:hypothetical protein [Flavobacterium sp.]
MKTLLHPTYFPSISHYVALINAKKIEFEFHDNFQKQTNRNRMYIYGANGVQLLTIPVKKSKTIPQKYRDTQIDYDSNWHKIHFKSIESAYRNSPFYDYYIDDIIPLFEKKYTFLFDLNVKIFETINSCIKIKLDYTKSTEYIKNSEDTLDYRYLTIGKKTNIQLEKYTQVFSNKYGFISDLSILDLLFNEGTYVVNYLKNQIIH